MKIKFLGTAAAEGVPAVFCNCKTCRHAKETGGKNIRTRSQILIDDDTLFDFPMDTYMHMLTYRFDLSKIKRVLITHAHMDHCYPQEFCMHGGPFAHDMTEQNIKVFCNQTVHDMFMSDIKREVRPEVEQTISVNTLRPFDEVVDGDMRIIALPASHTKGEQCLVYYLERNGVGILLMNDTGPLEFEVFERLYGMSARVDLAALDCTYGAIEHGAGRHMGLYDINNQVKLIRQARLFKENSTVIATHLSHNTDLDFDGIKALADPLGITVAYDGMEVEL
ncbi:MAG: hypothetical protein HDT28_04605 [Clostridiales bacterium]|nr:hypothetical protein [Clostridiales bacterium]